GLRIGRRVEQALQVAAVGEDECRAVTDDACRLVDGLPGCDVIGDTGNDVAVHLDLAHVAGRCARATTAHPVAPPASATNSRRFIRSAALPTAEGMKREVASPSIILRLLEAFIVNPILRRHNGADSVAKSD